VLKDLGAKSEGGNLEEMNKQTHKTKVAKNPTHHACLGIPNITSSHTATQFKNQVTMSQKYTGTSMNQMSIES
jgi:hypothetical protein